MLENKSARSETINIPIGKLKSSLKGNLWLITTIILAVLLVYFIFFKGSGVTGSTVSGNEAAQKLLSFISAQGKGDATLVSVQQDGSLYQVTVNYQNQDIPVFVTLDGKYLVTSPVQLSSDGSQAAADSGTGTNPTERVTVETGDSPTLGNVSAKVTVVEFSDFSCPYCAAASGDNEQMVSYMKQSNPNWEPIVTNMIKEYVDTGKVKFTVKYTPGHSGGRPAQLVAWCLNEQNLYWKFYPQAFANQDDVENLTKMQDLAKSIGADTTKLQSCLDSKKYDPRFDQEQAEGSKIGIQGTPGFVINGIIVGGAVPYSQVKSIIDSELAK